MIKGTELLFIWINVKYFWLALFTPSYKYRFDLKARHILEFLLGNQIRTRLRHWIDFIPFTVKSNNARPHLYVMRNKQNSVLYENSFKVIGFQSTTGRFQSKRLYGYLIKVVKSLAIFIWFWQHTWFITVVCSIRDSLRFGSPTRISELIKLKHS